MIDTTVDDCLDSDDDAFFLEASNTFLDNDFIIESTSIKQPVVDTSNYFKSSASTSAESHDVSTVSIIISDELKDINKNVNVEVCSSDNKLQASNLFPIEYEATNSKIKSHSNVSASSSNKVEIFHSTNVNKSESITKEVSVTTISSDCNISSIYPDSSKVCTPASSSYINSRFTPGFTPKAKKRKLIGPAGFLEFLDESKEAVADSCDKILSMDIEFQNIVGSQYTPEHLSLPSWQKLQTAVSSCSDLHSTAKYYSIQRVLKESSKKRMPKHIVVPVLCVMLKKLSDKGSTVISVFMDDTGEINGKIDEEVLSTYKEFLVEGAALILKKVTFLCNVLILKTQNLVSVYHPHGIEKHPRSLESVLEISEPLKPMNCECLKLSHVKKDMYMSPHYSTLYNPSPCCITHSQNRLSGIANQNEIIFQNNNTPKNNKSSSDKYVQNRTNSFSNQNKPAVGIGSNLIAKQNITVNEATNHSKNMRTNEFLEHLLDEDDCLDEFDEILGNLDEKSFMEDI